MSATSAVVGASALNGEALIIVSAARDCSRPSATAMSQPPDRSVGSAGGASVVGVLEVRVTAFVEGADSFDAVGMDRRTPVRLHHDRDRLLDRLPFAHPHGPLDCLHRRW